MTPESALHELRARMGAVNLRLLESLLEYYQVARMIGQEKDRLHLPHFDARREAEMLGEILEANAASPARLPDDMLARIFKEIFKNSTEFMGVQQRKTLRVHRNSGAGDHVITLPHGRIGGGEAAIIAGPCSVEGRDQLYKTAKPLRDAGVRFLRGGAFKPRSSPYSFQGLEEEGLILLREVADELGMDVVTEVLSVKDVELVARYADVLQVGTRNMANFSLLKVLGSLHKPILLKRGMCATMEEAILAAEYIASGGNNDIMLCERGIRTFETWTRNTLDLAAVALFKQETTLPVVVDVSHALGRKDLVARMAFAALAAGADAVMFECHCHPAAALSDADQQLDMEQAVALVRHIRDCDACIPSSMK
ncbi:bifunctional 3-deoxy-7-phosphoheptulonate synthase/chorismate mutase [Megalodesulfovibrio gigas]|uniref:chorismate mutase n=1 Tax=Megalodesulfovibrio gigas (strain ATCC 19364 / DSM 1382 / NCIMB 9332 / VKM B-1759) TaxID=1121448 RepID=T2GEM1_MEGG1|nr:bifunctional 3-deoxy-7-phosphoheptulonate synthase/chorismate mutase [Megalodesulfovibrio gigas]AGW14738.1 putative 3-deoxy-7-phosphoheptulonate synthase [Megalodesulfovibrio gigas DSM 1382 = ATCC 19364]